MNLSKREFLQVLGAGSVAGMGLGRWAHADAATASQALYDIPKFGNVSFLHMTDCHAQLKPIYFREPSVNLGISRHERQACRIWWASTCSRSPRCRPVPPTPMRSPTWTSSRPRSATARSAVSRTWPRWSKRLKASRPGALLLDGGDTWQGSGTALWTQGQDMVDAAKLLGVDIMTGPLGIHARHGPRQGDRGRRISPARSISWRRTSRPPISATRSSSPT